jgi:hypothetical protein
MADQNETNQNYLEKQNTLLSAQIKYFEKLAQLQGKSLKAMIEETEEREDAGKKFKREMGELTGKAIKNATTAFVGVAQSMAGGDLLGTAGAVMKYEVGMMADAAKGGANSLVDAGKKMQEAGRSGGAAIATFGAALGGAIGAIQQLTNVAIDFMIKETGILIKGFQGMSSAGATYTTGMAGMISTAHGAGMTLEQMSNATKANTESFTKSGLGVTEGSKRMAGAMAKGGDAARGGMFALGMTMEEQADAYAQTMKRMAGPMGKLNATNAEVAAQTEKYARDLKLISDLTGKSAKDQQAAADAATSSMIMQQQLMKMDPKARDEFMKALGGMTEESRKAIQDRMAHFGQVTDKTTAVLESVSPSLKRMHEEEYALAQAGKLTAEKEMELRARYGESINKELGNQEALGRAAATAGFAISDLSDRAGKNLIENGQVHQKQLDQSKEAIAQRQKEGKTGKGGMETQIMQAQQNFAVKLESIAANNLPKFGDALASTIKTIEGALTVMDKGGTWLQGLMSGWGAIIVPAMISIGGSVLGALLTRGLGGNVAGKAAGGVAGQASNVAGKAAGNVGAGIGEGLSGIGKGISAIGKGAGEAIGGILEGLAKGLSALGNPKVLLGVLSLAGVGAAIWVAGKAFMTFQDLDWESIAKGLVGVGAAGLGAAALGALALPMALGAGALLLVGASIAVMGLSLKALPDDILGTLTNLSKGIIALWDAPVIRIGAAGPTLGALGLGLLPLSLGIAAYKASGGMGTLATDMKTLQGLDPGKLKDVAAGIAAIRDAQSPSLAGMAKNAIAGAFEKLAGNSSPPADTKGTTKTAPSGDLLTAMNMLVKVSAESLQNQKEMLSELRDHSGTSKKILRANQ